MGALVRSGKVELYRGPHHKTTLGSPRRRSWTTVVRSPPTAWAHSSAATGRVVVDAVGLFESATGVDLAQAFGDNMVSNVAYYADSQPSEGFGVVRTP